jgi:glycosyltransferase involved in cell wall biosynthesis
MPAYNEEELLEETVAGVVPLVDRLFIVNDGSKDRTGQIAERLSRQHAGRVTVLTHERNQGIGGAVVTGMKAALAEADIDAVGIIASDNQCDPSLIPRFRTLLGQDEALDVAKGSRFLHPETLGQMPRFRYWGNRGVSWVMRLILGYRNMSDVLHGYILARAAVLRSLDWSQIAKGYDLENTMMAEFRRLRARFAIMPSPSRYGREKSKIKVHTQVPKTLARMLRVLLRRVVSGEPVDRLAPALLLLAPPLVVAGLALLLPLVAVAGGASVAASVALMLATSPSVNVLRS